MQVNKVLFFSFPETKPLPREQHPGLRWENKHSGVHWQIMGQAQPSHIPLSALLCNSPLPWQWLPLGRVWSNRDRSSRPRRPHNHRSPRLMTRASGGKKKKKKSHTLSLKASNGYTQQQLSYTTTLAVGTHYYETLKFQHEKAKYI